MKTVQTVLSVAEEKSAVLHLGNRAPDLLVAESESLLNEHLRGCGLRHVRRVSPIGPAEARLAAPHFTAADAEGSVEVYVLSVAGMASQAALTSEQMRRCERLVEPKLRVCVLPCLVQHLRGGKARCVAMPLVCVRKHGNWLNAPEVMQYLSPAHREGTASEMPCSAWLLKKHNLTREVANYGMQLFPLVKGFAHSGHMPEGMELKASGEQEPLMLVLTEGKVDGNLQLAYADFYSAENAVNELAVKELPADVDEDAPSLLLAAEDGTEYRARCAELLMFPGRMECGLRFRCALSVLCNHYRRLLPGEDVPFAAAGELSGKIRNVSRSSFCGLPLCHIVADVGKQTVNVYVPLHSDNSPMPSVGEMFCVRGTLYVVPDKLLGYETEPAAPASAPELTVDADMLPLSLALAVVNGGLKAAGYEYAAPFKPIFRMGRPEFQVHSPAGKRVVVLVDSVVNGHSDTLGYRKYASTSYPDFMGAVPPGNEPAELLFLTVYLDAAGEDAPGFRVRVEQNGAEQKGLTFCSEVAYTEASGVTEMTAARLFGEMMYTQSFSDFLQVLREDVHYVSETAGMQLHSKLDFVRYLRSCFDEWRQRDEMKNLTFLLSTVERNEVRRPCAVTCQNQQIVLATVFDMKEGRVAGVTTFAGSALNTLKPVRQDELT